MGLQVGVTQLWGSTTPHFFGDYMLAPPPTTLRAATCRRHLQSRITSRILPRYHPIVAHRVQSRPRATPLHAAERVLTHHHYTTATMALNASSHNVAGEKTQENTAAPPQLDADIKKDILGAAGEDATGQHQGGIENPKGAEKKEKSAKELEKERKKAEKDAKFKAKKAAAAQAGGPKDGAAPAKEKKKKKEEDQLPEYVEETPKGEKKILQSLDGPYTKAYIPKVVESAWDAWWEAQGFFKPEFAHGKVKPAGHFVIPIPPPNVTGKLHCGHALATSLQDVLIRWHRMKGYTTLYLPGCDHAGIATQSVVEKMLLRRENKTRYGTLKCLLAILAKCLLQLLSISLTLYPLVWQTWVDSSLLSGRCCGKMNTISI